MAGQEDFSRINARLRQQSPPSTPIAHTGLSLGFCDMEVHCEEEEKEKKKEKKGKGKRCRDSDLDVSLPPDASAGFSAGATHAKPPAESKNPSLVLEAIIGNDEEGNTYAPQCFCHIYDESNKNHKNLVEEALKKAVASWRKLEGCSCERIKVQIGAGGGSSCPSVLSGITRGFATKGLPTGRSATKRGRK